MSRHFCRSAGWPKSSENGLKGPLPSPTIGSCRRKAIHSRSWSCHRRSLLCMKILLLWQFLWSEKGLCGARVQRNKVIGTIERYPNETSARSVISVLLAEINSEKARIGTNSITVAQLCDHFEQRELAKDNTWRSHATKKSYQVYLNRWVRPHWRHQELAEVRTIQVESWLRGLPLAKSSCAKIRNLMSVLFNHACRYELFDRNPIHLVRQSAKRRRNTNGIDAR